MKNRKGHDYSTLIIWAASLVATIRYAAAFLAADLGKIEGWLSDLVTFLLAVSGFFTGILGTLGVAYLYDGWRQKMPADGRRWSAKFKALTFFVFASFLTEVLILVPFTMSRVLHVSVADVLDGGVWWWSTAVVIMPILLIGGVSVGNQIVMVSAENAGGNLAESGRKVSDSPSEDGGKFPNDWRKVFPSLTAEDVAWIAVAKTGDICYRFGQTEKTARNWRKYAQRDVSATTTSAETAQKLDVSSK